MSQLFPVQDNLTHWTHLTHLTHTAQQWQGFALQHKGLALQKQKREENFSLNLSTQSATVCILTETAKYTSLLVVLYGREMISLLFLGGWPYENLRLGAGAQTVDILAVGEDKQYGYNP